jgi:hypothetical protein
MHAPFMCLQLLLLPLLLLCNMTAAAVCLLQDLTVFVRSVLAAAYQPD